MNYKVKKVGLVLLSASILICSVPSLSYARKSYEINTVDELKSELSGLSEADRDNKRNQRAIIKKTDPGVIGMFIEEKNEEAIETLNAIDVDEVMKPSSDGDFYGRTCIDLGDGCEAIITFEDCEEENFIGKVGELFTPRVHAASNGEKVWKSYGNRYFTAKAKIISGIGYCECVLENHYKLSANGIDERYGVSYVSSGLSVGITGTVDAGDPIITDSVARTPGASDVNMYAIYSWVFDGGGIVVSQGTRKLSTTISYLAIDKTAKKIQVKHSWTY